MDIWRILFDVVVLLGAGAVLGGVFERFRQSAIVGYLLAGVLLGPNALNVVAESDEVLAVSELGVALLLFVIGLEFSWKRLRGMGRVVLGGGVLQIVVTGMVASGVASAVGFGARASVAVGAICALSSTACVLRVLTARGEVGTVRGERTLGILLVQDMAVLPLVLVVSVLAEGGSAQEVSWGVLRTAGIGLVLVAALYLIFNHLVPRLLETRPVHGNRELPLLIAVVSGLGSGVASHAVGVSPALGAFVAGLLLAESPVAVQVRADISSLKTLLLTLFFTAMGMLSDPGWIADHALLVGSTVLLVVVGKAAILWAGLRLFGARQRVAVATAVCLGQLGEFSFVLAAIARGRLLSETTFMLIVSVTVITMILTPYLVGFAPLLAARFIRHVPPKRRDPDEQQQGVPGIVIGFGPAGRATSERLAESGCHVVVVDENPGAAQDAHKLGYGSVTGDGRYPEVLEHAGLTVATVVVVTVPTLDTALQIVRLVRLQAPEARVLVRARFHTWLGRLREAGAHVVVDEEQEVGRLIAEAYEEFLAPAEGASATTA